MVGRLITLLPTQQLAAPDKKHYSACHHLQLAPLVVTCINCTRLLPSYSAPVAQGGLVCPCASTRASGSVGTFPYGLGSGAPYFPHQRAALCSIMPYCALASCSGPSYFPINVLCCVVHYTTWCATLLICTTKGMFSEGGHARAPWVACAMRRVRVTITVQQFQIRAGGHLCAPADMSCQSRVMSCMCSCR
jgi:hypothetical protein